MKLSRRQAIKQRKTARAKESRRMMALLNMGDDNLAKMMIDQLNRYHWPARTGYQTV